VENRVEFLRLRRMQQLERELDGYVEWICSAGRSSGGPRQVPPTEDGGLELYSRFRS
jgi:hypothetical protein